MEETAPPPGRSASAQITFLVFLGQVAAEAPDARRLQPHAARRATSIWEKTGVAGNLFLLAL